MKHLLHILLGLLLYSCTNKTASGQTMKSDTTFLLRETLKNNDYTFLHTIYIDTNKTSKYYKIMSNFTFTESATEEYEYGLGQLKQKNKKPLTKHKINGIPTKWCPLYIYNNNYYIFPSVMGFGWRNGSMQITDSTFIETGTEGPEPNRIKDFKKKDNNNFQISISENDTTQTTFEIHIIDEARGIAIFGDENNKERMQDTCKNCLFPIPPSYKRLPALMVDVDKIKLFPIIVDYTSGDNRMMFTKDTYPVKFQKPDFNKLLKKK